MKYIDIVIATRNRFAKLTKTIESISQNKDFRIYVICDGDNITASRLVEEQSFHTIGQKPLLTSKDVLIYINDHKGAVYCRNYAIRDCYDGVLYATDDIIFKPNSIENAFRAFNEQFPDDDGVVGFVQEPCDFHPTGVALVGQKFLKRYPEKQLFFPGYFHFACQEIHWLASKYGRFYQEKTAVIEHRHPGFYREEMDQTHEDARIYRAKDHALIKERQARGLIWGDS